VADSLNEERGAVSQLEEVQRLRELGDAELKQGRPRRAVEAYRKALALDPRDAGTLNSMGMAFSHRDWSEALKYFGAAYRLDPRTPRVANNLAAALLKNGRLDSAVQLVARRGSPLSYATATAVMRRYAESPDARQLPEIRSGIKWLKALLELLGRPEETGEITLGIFANYLHPLNPWREQALDRSTDTQLKRWVRVSGIERLKAVQEAGQGAILVVSHLAVERVATLLLSRMGFKLNTLEYENRLAIHGIAGAASVKVWEIKETDGFMLRVIYLAKKALQKGEIFLLAGDGYHGGNEMPLAFLGRQRHFKGGFAELAIAARVPAFPVFCTVDLEGRIDLEILEPLEAGDDSSGRAERVAGLVRQYVTLLEDCWRRHPGNIAWYHLRRYFALQADSSLEAPESGKPLATSLAKSTPAPGEAQAHFRGGLELAKQRRLEAAVARYDRALALDPGHVDAHFSRGKALRQMNRLEEALASFDQAIAFRADHAESFLNRGIVLGEMNRLDESLMSVESAIALRPTFPAAHVNRGLVRTYLGRFDEALEDYERSIAIRPNVAAYVNRGMLLQHLRRFDEALADYDRAIALKPDRADAYWGKADLKLLLGDYAEGWQLHEWRWRVESYRKQVRKFGLPLWLGGQALDDKSVLVHAEAGLGDAIQFSRYVPMLRAMKVILEVPSSLVPLMATLKGNITVVERGKPLPHFDVHCPMLSLPLAFRTAVDTIPATVPYLHVDPVKREAWRRKLGEKTKPRIGLTWSGRINRSIDRSPSRKRYCELHLLAPLLQLPLEFHSLQKEIRPEDAEALAGFEQIRVHHSDLNDFSDTAALIQEMDLVITVDTSVAHLAGALGKPVWVLLAYATDYRWMLDRTDSPWYPTATLFRQSTIGNWSDVISQVAQRLEETTRSYRGA